MLLEGRIAYIRREPLEVFVTRAPIIRPFRDLLQFVQDTWSQPFVDDVIGEMAEVLRAVDGVLRILDFAESKHLAVVVVREGSDPGLKFLGNEGLKYPRESVAGTNVLIAGRLINQSDDADMGKAPNQDFGL